MDRLEQVRRALKSGKGELRRVTDRMVEVKSAISELEREQAQLERRLGLQASAGPGRRGGRRPTGHGQAGRITVLEERVESWPAGVEVDVRSVVEQHGFGDRKRAAEALKVIAGRGFLERVGRGRYRRAGP
jgi:hypothetical protein